MAARLGFGALVKKGWHEAPELVASIGFAVAGFSLLGLHIFYRKTFIGEKAYQHRLEYTVIRDTDVDDPKKRETIYN